MRTFSLNTASQRAIALATVALGTLLLAAVAPGRPLAATSAAASSPPAVVDWSQNEALVRAAGVAEAAAGPFFTADEIDPTLGAVNVFMSGAPQSAIDAVQQSAGAKIIVHSASRTLAQMQQTQNQIGTDIDWLRRQGVSVRTVFPQSTGLLEIGVDSDPGLAEQVLGARYGSNLLTVVAGATVAFATTRAADTTPWNGGDFIYYRDSTAFSDCSSGSPVHDTTTGHHYMLTAAHCFYEAGVGQNTQVRNGYVGSLTSPIHGSNTIIGNVAKITPNTGTNTDTALIDANSSVVDFNCAWDCSGRNTQGGTLANSVNSQVCTSGAFEGEICSIVIRDVGGMICPGIGYCVQPVDDGTRNDSAIVAGDGDSGGPVYSYSASTGKLLIQGMIDAIGTSTTPVNELRNCSTATQYATIRQCSIRVFWTNFGSIRTTWGVDVNVG